MLNKYLSIYFALAIALLCPFTAQAQVVESGRSSRLALQAGGMGSIFQPDFNRNHWPVYSKYPIPGSSSQPLLCIGTYIDLDINRWFGVEAEGRWGRTNQTKVAESNYLLGLRAPITKLGRFHIYGKALMGYAKMDFGVYSATGQFTDIAFGGGAEVKLRHKLNLRVADFEYQYWPKWGVQTLKPYGLSAGLAYKFF